MWFSQLWSGRGRCENPPAPVSKKKEPQEAPKPEGGERGAGIQALFGVAVGPGTLQAPPVPLQPGVVLAVPQGLAGSTGGMLGAACPLCVPPCPLSPCPYSPCSSGQPRGWSTNRPGPGRRGLVLGTAPGPVGWGHGWQQPLGVVPCGGDMFGGVLACPLGTVPQPLELGHLLGL